MYVGADDCSLSVSITDSIFSGFLWCCMDEVETSSWESSLDVPESVGGSFIAYSSTKQFWCGITHALQLMLSLLPIFRTLQSVLL